MLQMDFQRSGLRPIGLGDVIALAVYLNGVAIVGAVNVRQLLQLVNVDGDG